MSQHVIRVTDLTVASGQTESNVLTASTDFRDADALTFFGPDTMPETITVHVSDLESGGDFDPLFRDGADVTIQAGKAITIELLAFKALKLVAGAAVGADRVTKVVKAVWA